MREKNVRCSYLGENRKSTCAGTAFDACPREMRPSKPCSVAFRPYVFVLYLTNTRLCDIISGGQHARREVVMAGVGLVVGWSTTIDLCACAAAAPLHQLIYSALQVCTTRPLSGPLLRLVPPVPLPTLSKVRDRPWTPVHLVDTMLVSPTIWPLGHQSRPAPS